MSSLKLLTSSNVTLSTHNRGQLEGNFTSQKLFSSIKNPNYSRNTVNQKLKSSPAMTGNMDDALKARIDEAASAAGDFIKHYYEHVDKKKPAINKLYMDEAVYVYNGNGFNGKDVIAKFITEMPKTEHQLSTMDAQPVLDSAAGRTILIQVSGLVKIGGQKSKAFQQTFTVTAQNEKWKIVTDCFRLQDGIYGERK